MYKKEEMDQRLLTIVVIAEKELMVLLNSDHITIRDYLKDKKQYQDHTVESYALDV
jgi:hypothetical protein